MEFHIWKDGGIKIETENLPKGVLVEQAKNPEQAEDSKTEPEAKLEDEKKAKPESEKRSQ